MNPVAYKRLPKEIAQARDLSGIGIYYIHDEDSIQYGHAMIFGPEGTPYAHCPLFFRIEFTTDYPFSPPKVTVLTSDGRTRFHPNLYVEGKVCLSILGTWAGPNWQSTMSLSTVLISLQSILDDSPLRNEPGYSTMRKEDARCQEYCLFIQYKMVKHTLSEYKNKHLFPLFEETAYEAIDFHLSKLRSLIDTKQDEEPLDLLNLPYSLYGTLNWKLLKTL